MNGWKFKWRSKRDVGGEGGGCDVDVIGAFGCVGGGGRGAEGTGPAEVVFEVGVWWVAGWGSGGSCGGGATSVVVARVNVGFKIMCVTFICVQNPNGRI